MQENKGTSHLYPLKLWSKIPYRRGVTQSELKYPIETHARNPKETQVALRRRASALSVARVRLYWALTFCTEIYIFLHLYVA